MLILALIGDQIKRESKDVKSTFWWRHVSCFSNPQRIHVWYIHLHLICMVNVGKYTSPMDPLGSVFGFLWPWAFWITYHCLYLWFQVRLPKNSEAGLTVWPGKRSWISVARAFSQPLAELKVRLGIGPLPSYTLPLYPAFSGKANAGQTRFARANADASRSNWALKRLGRSFSCWRMGVGTWRGWKDSPMIFDMFRTDKTIQISWDANICVS